MSPAPMSRPQHDVNGDLMGNPLPVLINLEGLNLRAMYRSLQVMHWGFLFPMAEADFVIVYRIWLVIDKGDLVICKLKYGNRILSKMTMADVEWGREIISQEAPDYNNGSMFMALACKGRNINSWRETIRGWNAQGGFRGIRPGRRSI